MNRPCISCGAPSPATRCPRCSTAHERAKLSAARRGYDRTWRELSRRARRLQPFCADCGATEALTTDHSPQAWQRRARGQVIRTRDVTVLCGPCNTRRGSARPGSNRAQTHGRHPPATPQETAGEATSRLQTVAAADGAVP